MLNLSVRTKLTPEQVTMQAVKFFAEGRGMKVIDQSSTCAHFEGSGGHVEVTSCTDPKGTEVSLITREWENQVKQFAATLAR